MQVRLKEINRRLQDLARAPQNPSLSEEFVTLFQEKRALETSLRSASKRRRGLPSADAHGQLDNRQRLEAHSKSILGNVSHELSKLEKRDWELWWIVSATGILVGTGFLAVLLPAALMKTGDFHFEISVPRQLIVGLLVLLILLNTYLVSRRVELRRLRQRMISSTIQSELVRLQSFTDPLTEVYNRRSLEELANRYINHARRLGKPLTFLLIDVDRFKQINTRFGHLTGDFVLAEIAGVLRVSVRGCDAVIRYGGDEFLTILADASASEAHKVVERIEAYLNDWNKSSHLEGCTVSLSIGVAEWTHGKALDEVLDLADQDMYAKKTLPSPPSPAKSAAATTS